MLLISLTACCSDVVKHLYDSLGLRCGLILNRFNLIPIHTDIRSSDFGQYRSDTDTEYRIGAPVLIMLTVKKFHSLDFGLL